MTFDFSKFVRDDPSYGGFQNWLEGNNQESQEKGLKFSCRDMDLLQKFLRGTLETKQVHKVLDEMSRSEVVVEESGAFFLVCRYSEGTFRVPRPMAII